MQIPRHRAHKPQKTMAQQIHWVLVILFSVFLICTSADILLLTNEGNRVIQEVDQMAELYVGELDNRFLRISRNLFSTVMERKQPDSQFWNYVDMMEGQEAVDYPLQKLREMRLSGIWEYGAEYQFFLYLAGGVNIIS